MLALRYMLFTASLIFFVVAFENPFTKCSINDERCLGTGWEKVFLSVGTTGIPELNVDPIDPMLFKNLTLTLLEGVTLFVKEGSVKGFKNCKVPKVRYDIEKKIETKNIVCDTLKITGEFDIGGSNQMLMTIFGTNSLKGHGRIKAKFEQVTMQIKLAIAVIKKEDGEVYFKLLNEKPQYTFDVQKADIDIKHLIVGGNDLSNIASVFLTSIWKSLEQTVGRSFIDKCLESLLIFGDKIYVSVPLKDYIVEDLTPYASN